jgi:hypothetical protein
MDKYKYDTKESFVITQALLGSNLVSYLTDNEEISVLDKIQSTIIGLYLADFASALHRPERKMRQNYLKK